MIQSVSRGTILAIGLLLCAAAAQAQQHATLVMDARTGRVIQAVNADTRVHPASLTKMMTLYIVFDQVRQGRLSLDQKITVSQNAANQPPSRLGLKAGQKIELRYLIRAAAIKSANDAATALGEAVAGSEEAFAARMNAYARAMGLTNTTFRNANGLTREGHLSTARDMAVLGRRLIYDFPQYYNIFGRVSTSAGIATVRNTNRRMLESYPGADGIKTGYTKAAGFNLVSSAQRGDRRVHAVDPPKEPRHVAVLGRHEEHLCRHERPRQVRAEHRHDQADADEHRSPTTDSGLEHPGHRGLAQLGDLRPGQDAVRHDRHAGEDTQHAQEAEHGRPPDVLSPPRPSRIHTRRFDTEEHEHGDEHRRAHLLEHRPGQVAAVEVLAEQVGLEAEGQDRDERQPEPEHPVEQRCVAGGQPLQAAIDGGEEAAVTE